MPFMLSYVADLATSPKAQSATASPKSKRRPETASKSRCFSRNQAHGISQSPDRPRLEACKHHQEIPGGVGERVSCMKSASGAGGLGLAAFPSRGIPAIFRLCLDTLDRRLTYPAPFASSASQIGSKWKQICHSLRRAVPLISKRNLGPHGICFWGRHSQLCVRRLLGSVQG